MNHRHEAIPTPGCCNNVKLLVWLSLFTEEPDAPPIWCMSTHRESAYRREDRDRPFFVKVKFCPCCATPMPKLKLKEYMPVPMGSRYDDYTCSGCGEREGCDCYSPLAAYETV
jgi:hypothetical protein